MNKCQLYCRTIKQSYSTASNDAGGEITIVDDISNYQKVEYLQSTGEQIIDIGVFNPADSAISLDFSLTDSALTPDTFFWLFGCKFDSDSLCCVSVYSISTYTRFYYPNQVEANGNWSQTSTSVVRNQTMVTYVPCIDMYDKADMIPGLRASLEARGITQGPYYMTIFLTPQDNGTYSFGVTEEPYYHNPKNVWLCGCNSDGQGYKTAGIRIYGASITDNNMFSGTPTTKQAFVPCYRKSDNVTGMFDTINNTFTPYTGTANFITGPNI